GFSDSHPARLEPPGYDVGVSVHPHEHVVDYVMQRIEALQLAQKFCFALRSALKRDQHKLICQHRIQRVEVTVGQSLYAHRLFHRHEFGLNVRLIRVLGRRLRKCQTHGRCNENKLIHLRSYKKTSAMGRFALLSSIPPKHPCSEMIEYTIPT